MSSSSLEERILERLIAPNGLSKAGLLDAYLDAYRFYTYLYQPRQIIDLGAQLDLQLQTNSENNVVELPATLLSEHYRYQAKAWEFINNRDPEVIEPPAAYLLLRIAPSLLPFLEQEHSLIIQLNECKKYTAEQLGFIISPEFVVEVDESLARGQYQISFFGITLGSGYIHPTQVFVVDSTPLSITEENVLPGYWCDAENLPTGDSVYYYSAVNVLCINVFYILLSEATHVMNEDCVKRILEIFQANDSERQLLISEFYPGVLPLKTIHTVLTNLISESVSLSNWTLVFSTMADFSIYSQEPVALTRYMRYFFPVINLFESRLVEL